MKRTLLIVALCICTATFAQEVRPREASMEDYIMLLKASGYEAYSFDLSDMADATYEIQFYVKEYVQGQSEPVYSQPYGMRRSRTMIKDFMWKERSPEEMAEIEKDAYDFKNGIFSVADKITIGFMPSKNDSTAVGRISIANMGQNGLELKLKPIETDMFAEPKYAYLSRPFKTGRFEEGKFIPLVLYCSFWHDRQHNVIRCCGEKEIDPEMTAEILKHTPHYYIIGITLVKTM